MSGHGPEEVSEDVVATANAMQRLARESELFQEAWGAWREVDAERWRRVLERVGVLDSCRLVCDWFCSKQCVLRCLRLAGGARSFHDQPDLDEFADVAGRLARNPNLLAKLVEVIDAGDADGYRQLLDEFDARRFGPLLCMWISSVRCRWVCRVVCSGDQRSVRLQQLVEELQAGATAIRKLAGQPNLLNRAARATVANDCESFQRVVTASGLGRQCHLLCLFFCTWRCVRVFVTLCREYLEDTPDLSDDEVEEFARITANLARQPEALAALTAAVIDVDADAFARHVEELGLGRFCSQLCHWICQLHCRRFCICVCPPLVARIDEPTAGACAVATAVTACMTASGPLVGIPIIGSAAGGGFDHYTLQYRWGSNPLVDAAVVYPDCSRPPGATSFSTAVAGGTLGWLDVTLLPPGVTSFTVQLDVFDAGSGTATASMTFEVSTQAISIDAVAKLEVLNAVDPFHPANVIRLVKGTNDPNLLVPERSVGGSFTIDGSAYAIGCDRIISQFVLARFDAPPSAPPPTPADASGGVNLITPVPYEDVPGHPWQSGCFPSLSPNTIVNGNLVAAWGEVKCTLGGFTYKVPKVKGHNWSSDPLNGRFVILLEVRDRVLPAGTHPGTLAGVAQVVVWIDNEAPTAAITWIGGLAGCGELLLSEFISSPAEIRGVAWDPPIVATAPQQPPNDNFGSYALTFRKDGETTTLGIPATTPNTRVPNTWPSLAPGTDGVLASWDIVTALDFTGSGATPPGMLARGERCAYVIGLSVADTTRVGDSGSSHHAQASYAITIINDL